jgi:hypothetical protein
MIPASERAKTVYALERVATVTGTQSNTRYTQLRERYTQWDMKAGAIYKTGRKSSYNIRIKKNNNNNNVP